MHIVKRVFVVWAVISLAGCIWHYSPPELSPDQSATVSGGEFKSAVTLKTLIAWIGEAVTSPSEQVTWVIAPGPQTVKVDVFASPPPVSGGLVDFAFTAEPREKYIAVASDVTYLNTTCAKASVWIENTEGVAVTGKKSLFMSGGGGPGYETMSGGVLLHFYPPPAPPCPPVPVPNK